MQSDKITVPRSGERRRYDDACGAAHALDLIGERWALLVMRELMFGPRRFSDLRAGLPDLSANVLTQRLGGLEAAGIVRRRRLPAPAGVQVYELTPWGQEGEELLRVLGRWAARSPGHDPTLPLSAASLMLSFRTMFDGDRVGEDSVRVGFRLGRDSFLATLDRDGIDVVRAEPDDADVVFQGDPGAIAAVVYGGRPLADALADGALVLTGDGALAERFGGFFVLPDKAG